MKCEDRYVVFIDIIGFRQLVLGHDHVDEDDVDDVWSVLQIIIEECEKGKVENLGIEFTYFSDSLVLSIPSGVEESGNDPLEDHPVVKILWVINKIAIQILAAGFFVRGGMARGPVFHKGPLVFGKAMIQAYDIETKIAHFPRIVLSKDVREDLKYLNSEDRKKVLFDFNDGPAFVHVLHGFVDLARRGKRNSKEGKQWNTNEKERLSILISIRENTLTRLEDSRDIPLFFKKNLWFANYLNEEVLKLGAETMADWPKPILLDRNYP